MGKKILFVSNYFGNGGAATVMKTIAEYLEKENYEVEVISFLDDEKIYKLPDNIKYTPIKYTSSNSTIQKIERIFKLRKIFKKNKNSTIISFEYFVNMQTIIANLGLKNKLIISERNDPSRVGNSKKNTRNFLYNLSDYLVCQTEDAKLYFPQKIQNKTIVIPNPIKDNLPERYDGKRKKEIVTFCRIEKQKNLKMLIDAFEILQKKYNDYKLVIYGDGSEKEKIEKYIIEKNLKNKIELYPFTNDIHEKIKKSAMFVSSSDYEGISNSMIEAMAIGLPTICTDCPCGGAKMMIEDGTNGLLVDVGNIKELSQKMLLLINDKKLSDIISVNGTKVKEKLSKNKICKLWREIIEVVNVK